MSRADRRFLIAVMLLGGCLRLYRLGHQSLWVDEILTYIVSNPKPGLNIWDYLKYNLHGPLHSFVVYLFHLAGRSDAWLRLPSTVAGVASIYFLYRWVDLWLGAGTARAAAFLLAIHPLAVHYSQEMRNYSFVLCFALAANFFFHRLLAEERKRTYAYYILTMAMAALSNFTAAFLFVSHSLIWFLRRGIRRPLLLRWILVGLAVLILISPWVYRIYVVIDLSRLVTPVMPGELTVDERLRGETTVTLAAVPYIAYVFSAGFSLGPSLRELHYRNSLSGIIADNAWVIGWVGLLYGFLLLLGIASLKNNRGCLLEAAIYLSVPVLFTFLLSWQNAKAFNIRYVLLSLPAFLCLLASGLLAFRGPRAAALWVLLVATTGWSLANYYFSDRYAKEDVRAAAVYIDGLEAKPRCILVPTVRDVFAHYYKGEAELFGVFAPSGTHRKSVEGRLERLFARCNSFWYVRAREWVDDADGHILGILNQRCLTLESIEINGVTLLHYRLKSQSDH